jgi:hypothetical protein
MVDVRDDRRFVGKFVEERSEDASWMKSIRCKVEILKSSIDFYR